MFKSLTIPNTQHSIYKFDIGSKYTHTQNTMEEPADLRESNTREWIDGRMGEFVVFFFFLHFGGCRINHTSVHTRSLLRSSALANETNPMPKYTTKVIQQNESEK